jgi:hypothetical protein
MAFRVFLLVVLISVQRCGTTPAHAPAETNPVPVPGPAAPTTAPVPASPAVAAPSEPVSFASQIRPLLEARCTPCHFPGGVMYEKLPFDREATIRRLGTRLFTRIQEAKDQDLILRLLARPGPTEDRECQGASAGNASPPPP